VEAKNREISTGKKRGKVSERKEKIKMKSRMKWEIRIIKKCVYSPQVTVTVIILGDFFLGRKTQFNCNL
jgi:hypothetical protein